jgi:outer membrane receptor for ferrienterochelin and colicin
MIRDLIKYFIALITLSITTLAQVEDSVSVSLESLLSADIEAIKVVESASKYSQSPEDAPSSVSIITSKEIETYGYQTLAELINSQVGFYISNDRNYDYIGVRGFSRPTDYNNRILLLIDGHRLNEYIYDGGVFGRELGLDINNFERVEIIRGPGSSLYGTSAMFAVINLVPKKIFNLLSPVIKLSYGSFGTKSISLNAGQKVDNEISFSINGAYTESDGEDIYFSEFDDPGTNSGLAVGRDYGKHYGIIGSFNYKNFKLHGFSSFSQKGVPTAPWDTDYNVDQDGTDKFNFIEASLFHNLSYNSQVSIKVYFDKYSWIANYPYEGEESFDKDDGETVGSEVQFIWDVLPNNRITAGVDYKNILRADYKYWDDYYVYNEFDVPYKMLSFYIQDEFQLSSKLSFYLGLRHDNYIDFESSLSPRVGIIYNPWQHHTFKLLYGKAFRAPNAYERKYEDPLYGFKINPNGLSPENAYTSEFIWDYKISSYLTSSTSLYYYRITDLIDQIEDPEDEFYYFENYGKTEAFGADISFEGKFSYSSGAYLRFSYQNTKDESSNTLTNSPSHLLKLGVFHKIFNPINVAFEYKYGSKRITVYETETDPIHLAKVNVFTDQLLDHFKLSFSVNNLLDSTIKHPGGWEHYQPSIIQYGRNYHFSISYGF